MHPLYALGRSRVFLRAEALAALQTALQSALGKCATKAQAMARGKSARALLSESREAAIVLQARARALSVRAMAKVRTRHEAAVKVQAITRGRAHARHGRRHGVVSGSRISGIARPSRSNAPPAARSHASWQLASRRRRNHRCGASRPSSRR